MAGRGGWWGFGINEKSPTSCRRRLRGLAFLKMTAKKILWTVLGATLVALLVVNWWASYMPR
jgi:hypothetical protein